MEADRTDADVVRQLTGAWRLQRMVMTLPDGSTVEPLGVRPAGQISYGADGHMSAHLERVGDGSSSVPIDRYTGYYGRFSVNVANATVTHHVEGASLVTMIGTDQPRRFRFDGDQLILSADAPMPVELRWRRLSAQLA